MSLGHLLWIDLYEKEEVCPVVESVVETELVVAVGCRGLSATSVVLYPSGESCDYSGLVGLCTSCVSEVSDSMYSLKVETVEWSVFHSCYGRGVVFVILVLKWRSNLVLGTVRKVVFGVVLRVDGIVDYF